MQVICCVCQKTKSRNLWRKKAADPGTKLSHGYCPHCYQQLLERVHNHSASQE